MSAGAVAMASGIDFMQARHAWATLCGLMGIDETEARTAVADWSSRLDAQPSPRSYSALPAGFRARLRAAVEGAAPGHALRWLDLVLIGEIQRFEARFEQARLPPSLLPEFHENLARMLDRAGRPQAWARSIDDDVFLKDLAILRTTLLPCASHLIFRHSGVPRRLLLQQRPTGLLRALGFFAWRCGGFAPFLENHVHTAMLAHFDAAGRERCYRLVAELLQLWPDSKGLMGLSWYYDPVVARLSPRLAYLHDVPAAAGALFLPAGDGDDVVGGATSTSPTRRRLYEQGLYRPTRYLMAWSRHDLLRHTGR